MAAPHGDVLAVLVSLAALLLLARLLGEVATRLRQPAVVGEILAGVLLGPSVLGVIAPYLSRWVVPQTPVQGYLVEMVALIGVMLLLVITGLETDLTLIRRKARTAMGVAVGGLALPFASGLALGWLFPQDLIAGPEQRVVFALFLATALSISAIPVLAKILMDLRVLRRDLGQTMLAAGMIDDITGWTLLGIVAALAGAGSLAVGQVARSIATVLIFIGATAFIGRVLVSRSLAFVQDRARSRDRLLTLVVVLAFAWAAFTQWLRLEPVLGAFAIGILFGQLRRLPTEVAHKLESIALAIFAPIFFAVAGLKVDISRLAEPRLLRITGLVIAVATFGKVVGAYLGARLFSRQGHWTALAYGAGLNARGAVEIIIASIGLSLGILSQEVFSMVVVMAVVTSLIAPFALRVILPRIELDPEEIARMQREDLAEGSLTGRIRRVLVPVRPRGEVRGGAQHVEASILSRLASNRRLAVTLLSVAQRGQRASIAEFQESLAPLFGTNTEVTRRIVEARSPAAAVLAEAVHDYDLLVLGASEGASTVENLFGGVVDEIVRLAPIPSLVVRGDHTDSSWRPRRLVVPTDGTVASRRAAELAFTVAEDTALVTVVHIVPLETSAVREVLGSTDPAARLEIGQQIASDLRALGESFGVATEIEVRMGPEPEEAILATARRIQADLVVLGTSVRVGSSRLFLGPRVERILSACPCPVVVLNS
jgi:Kef-type K+ transport system membrane component KefB